MQWLRRCKGSRKHEGTTWKSERWPEFGNYWRKGWTREAYSPFLGNVQIYKIFGGMLGFLGYLVFGPRDFLFRHGS